jgi:hypothetical protein
MEKLMVGFMINQPKLFLCYKSLCFFTIYEQGYDFEKI